MHDIQLYKDTYDKYKNLKLAASELGIKWQSLYVHLMNANHPVTGDKERYGNATDRMAKFTEDNFQKLIPYAKDNNSSKFQAKIDFEVKGFNVDVKCSTKKDGNKNNPKKKSAYRWAFACKTQEELYVDFIVCFCYEGFDVGSHGNVEKILLIPFELIKGKQSISCSVVKSKWDEFVVTEDELKEFFDNL